MLGVRQLALIWEHPQDVLLETSNLGFKVWVEKAADEMTLNFNFKADRWHFFSIGYPPPYHEYVPSGLSALSRSL